MAAPAARSGVRRHTSVASPTVLVSSGEPAGVGPDLCVLLARRDWPARICVLGDPSLLAERARQLAADIEIAPVAAIAATEPHRKDVCALAPTLAGCAAKRPTTPQTSAARGRSGRAPPRSPRPGRDGRGQSYPSSSREPKQATRPRDSAWYPALAELAQSSSPSNVLRILSSVVASMSSRTPLE